MTFWSILQTHRALFNHTGGGRLPQVSFTIVPFTQFVSSFNNNLLRVFMHQSSRLAVLCIRIAEIAVNLLYMDVLGCMIVHILPVLIYA